MRTTEHYVSAPEPVVVEFRLTDAEVIVVRKIATIEEYRACQEVQRRSFDLSDEGYVVPVATMVGAQLHGGLVIGAFHRADSEERLVGFSFAFLGRIGDRIGLYSQITAVDPNVQAGGVGTGLKMFQREWARGQGLPVIAWAFDPLQALNAHLNLNKLGARVRDYVEDMYGTRSDRLSRGVPSDRLIVEWETALAAPRPERTFGDLPRAIDVTVGADGLARPGTVDLALDVEELLIEIPESIVAVKEADPAAGLRWHEAVRRAFNGYLARGYRVAGFLRREEQGRRRCYYVLGREGAP